MDVEVISKENVKPSTPTPKHLREYKISFVDQLSPSFHIPLIHFYNLDHNLTNNAISGGLKRSLSRVLTHYYPLAGCLKDDHVDCNDEGVLFLEAQVRCNISSFIREPNSPSELKKFLPHNQDLRNFILGIQVNFFDCGNVAIGACLSHKIADASAFITFIKNWAAVASGGDTEVKICIELLSAPTLFPPRDVGEASKTIVPPEKNIVCKRFVFSGSTIAALKEKYADGIFPTRFEALSSFIWSRFAASTQIKIGPETVFMLGLAVNLRKRMNPPQPDDSFGNITGSTATTFSKEIGEEFRGLVKKLRNAIGKINNDYVKKLQEGVFERFGLSESSDDEGRDKREVVPFYYTSFCRFPLYEADFGWGRPVWVAWGDCLPYSNVAVFMDTKYGKGIETWIHLKEEDMVKFEADKELLSSVSPTSCP